MQEKSDPYDFRSYYIKFCLSELPANSKQVSKYDALDMYLPTKLFHGVFDALIIGGHNYFRSSTGDRLQSCHHTGTVDPVRQKIFP